MSELHSWWAQRNETREWDLETQRTDISTKPVLSSTSPETIQFSHGQTERAASVLLPAESPYWNTCPAFSPQVPSTLEAAVSANLLEPSKLFSSGMIKGLCTSALSQLHRLKIVNHRYSDCLGWGSKNWRKRKKAFCLPTHNHKIWCRGGGYIWIFVICILQDVLVGFYSAS